MSDQFFIFFQESVLNGRIEPVGVVEGFKAEIGAGGRFCPKHITLPVTAYFFQLSDDNAPSPYFIFDKFLSQPTSSNSLMTMPLLHI